MVVVFGWGTGEAQDLGEVAPTTCPNCHNEVFLTTSGPRSGSASISSH